MTKKYAIQSLSSKRFLSRVSGWVVEATETEMWHSEEAAIEYLENSGVVVPVTVIAVYL